MIMSEAGLQPLGQKPTCTTAALILPIEKGVLNCPGFSFFLAIDKGNDELIRGHDPYGSMTVRASNLSNRFL
jgi:hypothetical protein